MSRVQLLSPAQRAQLFQVSEEMSERDIVRYYSFSATDLAIIKEQRGDHNRLGFALLLSYLRFPGRPFQPDEYVPMPILTYVATQLGVSHSLFSLYAKRATTRREHLIKLQKIYQYRSLTKKNKAQLSDFLLAIAMQTDNGMTLVTALIEEMRAQKIIIPSVSAVEQLVAIVRTKAQQVVFSRLIQELSPQQKQRLDRLFILREGKESYLSWLKNFPQRPSSSSVLALIERMEHLKQIALPQSASQGIAEQRLARLAKETGKYTVQHLQRLKDRERYALLVAFLLEFRKELIDQIILMHDKLIGQLFNRSERQLKDAFHKTGRAVNEKVRLYARVGKALIEAKQTKTDWYQALQSVISWDTFVATVAEAEHLARDENFDYLSEMKNRYSWLRQYTPKMLETLKLKAIPSSASLLTALEIIKDLNRTGKRKVPTDAPCDFITPRWERYVLRSGEIDRVYYEVTVRRYMGRRKPGIWGFQYVSVIRQGVANTASQRKNRHCSSVQLARIHREADR